MKRICTLCGRKSLDGNLWCQDINCPAEDTPNILSYGDLLGDVKIIRLMNNLQTSAVYEGERDDEPILVKVAHPYCEKQLKREAHIFQKFALANQRRQRQGVFSKIFPNNRKNNSGHPHLPLLLSAYKYSNVEFHPYGEAMIGGKKKFFEVFEYIDADFLRDVLSKMPQPWHQHAAWVVINIAETAGYISKNVKIFHLNLNPDIIMVRIDDDGIFRPVLIDLGVMLDVRKSEAEQIQDINWLRRYGNTAYTAPELTYHSYNELKRRGPYFSPATDVYGAGLIFYELLSGRPRFDSNFKSKDAIRMEIKDFKHEPLNRSDLEEVAHNILDKAIHKREDKRFQDVYEFAGTLRKYFGDVPPETIKRSLGYKLLVIGIVVLTVLAIITLLIAWLMPAVS